MEEMGEDDIKLKIVLCQQLLEVQDIINPGLTLGRGLILYELHSALVMLANLEYAVSHNTNKLTNKLEESEALLLEAIRILSIHLSPAAAMDPMSRATSSPPP